MVRFLSHFRESPLPGIASCGFSFDFMERSRDGLPFVSDRRQEDHPVVAIGFLRLDDTEFHGLTAMELAKQHERRREEQRKGTTK